MEKGTLVSYKWLPPTELWVNGVDILDPSATLPTGVSYNTETRATLNGVTIDTASDSSSESGIYANNALTIVLEGQNSIGGADMECGILLDSGALTLSGEGSLEVSGSDCGIAAYAGVTVEDSVSSSPSRLVFYDDGAPITIGETEYDPYSDLFQIVTVENGELISNEWLPPTKLYVNGVDILAPDATLPKGVSYEDGVLTLNGVTIDSVSDSAPPFGIYSDRALTIVLEGQNFIAGEDFECGIYLHSGALTLSGDGSLEVSGSFYGIAAFAGVSVEDSVSELTVSGNDGAFFTDGALITIGETEYDPYSDLLQLVTVEKGELIANKLLPTELYVNGVDILTNPGDAPQGVSYDAKTGALTLNGVTIDTASDSSSDSGIYADNALTIVLEGQNSIAGEGIERGILLDSGALTLSGDGSLEVSGSDCGIAAFAGVSVENSVSALTVSGPSGAFSTAEGAPITIGGERNITPMSDLYPARHGGKGHAGFQQMAASHRALG